MRCRVFSPRPLIVPVAAAVLAALPLRSFAWSAHGHEMVGAIAQALLVQGQDPVSQTTVANLKQLLGPELDLAALAPCADKIKRNNERTRQGEPADPAPPQTVSCGGLALKVDTQSAAWHFIDIPTSADPQSSEDLETWCAGGACVVDQIRGDIQTLQSSGATLAEKQVALMYLVHLVGDEHQPLHCATDDNDRGGNDKPVAFAPDFPMTAADKAQLAQDAKRHETPELHALWDQIIEPEDDLDVAALSQSLAADIQGKTPDELTLWVSGVAGDGDIVTQAALESFHIARDVIYQRWKQDVDNKTVDASGARL